MLRTVSVTINLSFESTLWQSLEKDPFVLFVLCSGLNLLDNPPHRVEASFSSNINEVIRSVLNFFFHDKILHAQKAQKEYKAPKSTKKH